MTYTYDPLKIGERGKDQMRLELGDTFTDGGAMTSALADEEYEGILNGIRPGRRAWLYAKLYALETIMFKISYQVDTKIDALSYSLGARAQLWQALYDKIRKQILSSTGLPVMDERAMKKPPYFYTGMQENVKAKGKNTPPFRKIVT